jgi:hypothetical protein
MCRWPTGNSKCDTEMVTVTIYIIDMEKEAHLEGYLVDKAGQRLNSLRRNTDSWLGWVGYCIQNYIPKGWGAENTIMT